MKGMKSVIYLLAAIGICLTLLIQTGAASSQAAEPQSSVAPVAERDVYYPGSEALGPDEMRIVACGTGMPNARPKQAAACFLVELGNGDKFIFDIGTGSSERISAMNIPDNKYPVNTCNLVGRNVF